MTSRVFVPLGTLGVGLRPTRAVRARHHAVAFPPSARTRAPFTSLVAHPPFFPTLWPLRGPSTDSPTLPDTRNHLATSHRPTLGPTQLTPIRPIRHSDSVEALTSHVHVGAHRLGLRKALGATTAATTA